MISSTKWCLLVLYFITLVHASAYHRSDVVWDFISVFNGIWNNRAGVQAGLATDVLEARFVPVDIPAFRNVTIDKTNPNAVLLIPYNFTGSRTYKTGEYNLGDLSTLTPADIKDYKRCTVMFQRTGGGVFSGLCPHCNHTTNEAHPACTLTFTCDSYTVTRPSSVTKPSKPLQDVLHLKGSRYPLKDTPKGYTSPCQQRT